MALTPEEQAQYNALAAKAAQVEESAPAEVAGETAAEVGAAVAEAVGEVAVAVAHAVAQEVGDAHEAAAVDNAELVEKIGTAELIAETALAVALLDDEPAPEVEAAADVIEDAAETVEEAVEQLDEHHEEAGGGDDDDDAPQVKPHPWFKPRGKGKS